MVQRTKSRLGADATAVGFLVDRIEDGYQSAIAAGVLKAAKDAAKVTQTDIWTTQIPTIPVIPANMLVQ